MVDLVIAYVDNTDNVWKQNYVNYCIKISRRDKICELHGERYEDIGLINYQLKLVEKNMPFINKIYLLVSNIEQVPKGISDKVVVVLHDQFIPQKYLPTFNSTTIEMFLWNIPNLSERFIYANDDMLPTKPLKETDFFENDKIKVSWVSDKIKIPNQFRWQCWFSYSHILEKLGFTTKKYEYEKPFHSMTPMIKSHCVEAYNLIEKEIVKRIKAFRTDYQHNQYIYPIYEKYKYGTLDSEIDFCYTELKKELDLDHQITCINIIPRNKQRIVIERLNKLCEL